MGLGNITEAKWYKSMMPKLYGWGAALVILGALFKIEHWQGASTMLIIGLSTEAIIFFFSAFEKTSEEYQWEKVYPELGSGQMIDPANMTPAQQLDSALEKAKIENELIDSLNEGLRAFGESAAKLNETISASAGISDYTSQIEEGVKNNLYEKNFTNLIKSKNIVLNELNLFMRIANIVNNDNEKKSLKKKRITLKNVSIYEKKYRRNNNVKKNLYKIINSK